MIMALWIESLLLLLLVYFIGLAIGWFIWGRSEA